MRQTKVYRYLGRNGIITTPILIDGANAIVMYRLIADADKVLTNGNHSVNTVDVFEDELNNWFEIPRPVEE
jgi:hypothetical protein